jgi:hypothetical protein
MELFTSGIAGRRGTGQCGNEYRSLPGRLGGGVKFRQAMMPTITNAGTTRRFLRAGNGARVFYNQSST